jgi:hypothetical protein
MRNTGSRAWTKQAGGLFRTANPTSPEAGNWNRGAHGDFFRAPDPFVLFVSFVVKKITDKKSDFTAENAKNAGVFTTKSTKDHEG